MLKTIIVDDEAGGRSTLKNFLIRYCDAVNVVGEASSAANAVELITALNPQLVFLDIDMPGGDGFELLSKFDAPLFQTIFVTAHDQYALRAIKYQALDYLLKPVDIDELIRAVDRARRKIHERTSALSAYDLPPARHIAAEKIALPVMEGFVYKSITDIIYCEAEGNYTQFYFADKTKLLVCRTLGNYENQLIDRGFVRIHHHHLVNVAHIVKYQRGRGGAVLLADGTELIVSQRKKDELLRVLNHGRNEAL